MDEPDSHKPGFLERLGALIMREPEDRNQLIQLLHSAFERNLLDADALAMIEGALQVSEMSVRDVMIPRSQMDVIDINETPDRFIPHVIATAHSRFPVIDRDRDHVIGTLLAKDLLIHVTGFFRDGCCNTGPADHGRHTVCAKMTAEFLAFSKARGNDLSTPRPEYGFAALRPGDRWCLCADRWKEAWLAGAAPIPRPQDIADRSVVPENRFEKTNTRADVIFAFFGYNESWAGEAGVQKFKADVASQVKGSLLMDSLAQVAEDKSFAAISEPSKTR